MDIIDRCFKQHEKLFTKIYFTFEEYKKYWLEFEKSKKYYLVNKDGTEERCTIVYYPLEYKDLRVLIHLDGTIAYFKEVPVKFLRKV